MGSGRYKNNSVELGEQTSSRQRDSFSFIVARVCRVGHGESCLGKKS